MEKSITIELTQLAAEINAEHLQCLQAIRASLDHALKVGQLLNAAKELVDHGGWLPWIEDNCEFSERTARAYMRVSRNWPQLSKTATTADLTLSGALKLLQEPTKPPVMVDYQNNDLYPDASTDNFKITLSDFNRRLGEANTIQEAMKLEKEIKKFELVYKMRYIESVWEFGKVLNEIEESGNPISFKELGINPRHARQAKALSTVSGGLLLQYFSDVEELTEASNGNYELTLWQVLHDCVYIPIYQ